ncbi:PIR Superfamily Protein [Plasmodium ovale curtisi]|uniref:PIR Superfamily Protein n=1 Tax=Plasmodium ovale curtisi TaxID=864141 RepID=A0A1A8XCG5_PLAOA|nr:PIR Superfamily Protein [Plasmodium ovale curtisi]
MNENYETLEIYSYHNSILNIHNGLTDPISDEYFKGVIPNETPNRTNIIENCKKLNNYIARSISEKRADTNVCFQIINYWLNDLLRPGSEDIQKSRLNIYKEFMQKYTKLNSYVSNIYYIHDKIFMKKKELYKLYKKYNDLLNILENYNSSKCVDISNLVNDYNNIIEQYPNKDNSNFSEVLTKFRSEFEKVAEEYINNCSPKILPFRSFIEPPSATVRYADHSQQITEDGDELHIHSSENMISTFTLTLFGTTIGVFLTLLVFYKITLFGYRLRNKRNENILIPNNLSEETYELPVYTLEEHKRISPYRTYNVTYQSVGN